MSNAKQYFWVVEILEAKISSDFLDQNLQKSRQKNSGEWCDKTLFSLLRLLYLFRLFISAFYSIKMQQCSFQFCDLVDGFNGKHMR